MSKYMSVYDAVVVSNISDAKHPASLHKHMDLHALGHFSGLGTFMDDVCELYRPGFLQQIH